MDKEQLKTRTKQFALRIIRLVQALPNSLEGRIIGKQLISAGTSVGANYRSACRGRSRAEFLSKLGIVEEEADESAFWLELIIEAKLLDAKMVNPLLQEANEIVAIMVSAKKTTRQNLKKSKIDRISSWQTLGTSFAYPVSPRTLGSERSKSRPLKG